MKTPTLLLILAMVLMATSAFRFQSRMQTQTENQAEAQAQTMSDIAECMNCANVHGCGDAIELSCCSAACPNSAFYQQCALQFQYLGC